MKKALSLVLALVLCLSMIACSSEREVEQIEAIKYEYISIFDKEVENFLSTYNEYNITNIKYEIADVSKHKGLGSDDEEYVISLMVYVTCDEDNLSKAARGLIGYDVFYIFKPFSNGFSLAGKNWSYRPPTDGNTLYDNRITIFVNDSYVMGPEDIAILAPSKSNNLEDTWGHDEFDAVTVAEKIVKGKLKSPSTAEFCKHKEYTITCSGDTWTIKGYVDAQNSFGATLRNNFTVEITFTSSSKYTIDSCIIN